MPSPSSAQFHLSSQPVSIVVPCDSDIVFPNAGLRICVILPLTDMKVSAALLFTMALGLCALADDQVRDAQAELKNQGFFYGEVDGKEGPESSAAIRRYQIRNGLKVTGQLNDETLEALGINKGTATPAKPPTLEAPKPGQVNPPGVNTPPQPTARPRQDLLRDTEQGNDQPSTAPGGTYDPEDPAVVSPPSRIPPAVQDDYSTFFHGTPYASAPVEVQFDIVRKAQRLLTQRGFYQGAVNGLPATLTADALFEYQRQRRLSRTGRLDLQTLGDLNLLPGRGSETPAVRPFYDPNRRRDRSVDYRGIIR
jgi:peptidoglycan hydrolase-like protein with peptidoglycan-binding domain